jgi:hypothetical protein
MNIYLDVEGTLLTKQGFPAPYVEEFLELVISNHDCHWLTTHCEGDSRKLLDYLRDFFHGRIFNLLKTIKPTKWKTLKTDAIDFQSDFRWFDDNVLEAEKEVLKRHHCENRFVLVNLQTNPNCFRDWCSRGEGL